MIEPKQMLSNNIFFSLVDKMDDNENLACRIKREKRSMR